MFEIEDLFKWKETENKVVHRFVLDGHEWTLIKVKEGCTAGEHYHKGTVRSKNPEVLIILDGKLEAYFKDIRTGEEKTLQISGPKIIRIKPFVYHEMRAKTNLLMLEEYTEEQLKDKFLLENDEGTK